MKNNLKGGLLFVVLTSSAILSIGCSEQQPLSTTHLDTEQKTEVDTINVTPDSEIVKDSATSEDKALKEAIVVDFAKLATLDLLTIDSSESFFSQIGSSKKNFFAQKPDYYTSDYVDLMLEELGIASNTVSELRSVTPEVIGEISVNDSNNSVNSYGKRYWTVKIPLRLTFETINDKVVKDEDVVVEVINNEASTKGEKDHKLVVSAIKIEK